jgi:hypothetical protein
MKYDHGIFFQMEDRVADATVPHPPMEVLSSAFKLDITRKDMRTLVGLEVSVAREWG